MALIQDTHVVVASVILSRHTPPHAATISRDMFRDRVSLPPPARASAAPRRYWLCPLWSLLALLPLRAASSFSPLHHCPPRYAAPFAVATLVVVMPVIILFTVFSAEFDMIYSHVAVTVEHHAGHRLDIFISLFYRRLIYARQRFSPCRRRRCRRLRQAKCAGCQEARHDAAA